MSAPNPNINWDELLPGATAVTMPEPAADVHPAVQYATALFNPDDLLCLTFIHSTKKWPNGRSVTENYFVPFAEAVSDAGIKRLTIRNKDGWQVYVSMAPFKPGSTKRHKPNIASAAHVFAEADANGEAALAAVRESIAAGEIPAPTIVVQSSPHKYHFIWNVVGFTIPAVEAMNRALEKKFGTDSVSDVARVLRIPGFRNIKTKYGESKPMAAIVEYNKPPATGITISDFKIPLEHERPAVVLEPARPRSEDPLAAIVDAIPDEELIGRLKASDQGAKFSKLMAGENPKGYFAASNSLCAILAWWTHNNPERIDRIYKTSKLYTDPPLDGGPTGPEWWSEPIDGSLTRGAKTIACSCARYAIGSMYTPPIAPSAEPAQVVSAATQTESLLVSRKANSITPKEIKWLWQDKIPLGKLTLFGGNPDNGKSIVSVSLAAIASTAQAFPGSHFSHEPADVLMLVGEDDLDDTVVPRLLAAGADMDHIDFPEAVLPVQAASREIRLDFDVPAIERKLIANPNIRLITIDPISNYLGDVPMSADQDVRSMILMPLKRLAEKYNVAVVIVMHLNKKSDLDAINRVGGAMAFIAVCRVAWLFARNVEDSTEGEDVTIAADMPDTFSMLCIKNNIAKAYHTGLSYNVQVRGVKIDGKSIPEPYVVWGHAIKGSADDALKTLKQKFHASVAHAGGRPNTKMQEATDWLTDALQDGEPHPNGLLMQEAKERDNIKTDTLKEAYRRMVDAGIAKRAWKVGSAYVWKLIPMHAGSEDSAVPQQSELISTDGNL